MSRKTNIGKKPIVKGYGIQPYRVCEKTYSEVILTPTFKAANDATVVRESEFAKPYGDEDYSGMEYAAPNWPGEDFSIWDFPDMGLPPDFPDMYDPWHMNFRCNVDPCWCEGETKTFVAGCTYEIADAKFVPLEGDLSATFTKNTVSITAATGIRSGESGYLTITMKAYVPKGGGLWQGKYDPVYGTHSSISVGECDDSMCCNGAGMSWDSDTSASTIQRYNDCVVAIKDSLGAGGPYAWAVSGTGYSLDYAETTGLLNTLNADGTACNPAIITVTGCDGTQVEGEVWCTAGSWVMKAHCDNSACGIWIIPECCCFFVQKTGSLYSRYQSYMYCCLPGIGPCTNYCTDYGWWEDNCENTDPACTVSLGAWCHTDADTPPKDYYWYVEASRKDDWECT